MDKETFIREVKSRERQMYRIARSYSLSDAECCDVVQESLMRAWAKRGTLRDESVFGSWLIRILINECKSALRKRAKIVYLQEFPDIPVEADFLHDDELERALFALPEKFRVPLVLNTLDGYTLKEIAGILQLPEGTVKSRVSRAKKRLQRLFAQEVDDDEAY